MPSSVPDVIYALASIAGALAGALKRCVLGSRATLQQKRLTPPRKSEEELLGPPVPELGVDGNPIEDEPVERCFEYDHRGENKSGYILEYGCTGCHVIKLELASIKADSAAAAKLTDHVYCLLKVQTDTGRPNRPDMRWRTQAFVTPQSAANAARDWFLE